MKTGRPSKIAGYAILLSKLHVLTIEQKDMIIQMHMQKYDA
ncbi:MULTISPECIES: hypothetical protein [Bacillus]|uniref:Sugar diacid utilization regulator n=1 Tax=Bacillus capparidis TaxID=1840411 RepID=A0ABS4CRK1_9BACI|nr:MULTISPECIES: hypothetical protein [Bacillus]MBP1079781.1 sugar diacid utilization regulator [Bacillus capparidis]MED1095173.1 hypothetical protein [Bacillus capparidis]